MCLRYDSEAPAERFSRLQHTLELATTRSTCKFWLVEIVNDDPSWTPPASRLKTSFLLCVADGCVCSHHHTLTGLRWPNHSIQLPQRSRDKEMTRRAVRVFFYPRPFPHPGPQTADRDALESCLERGMITREFTKLLSPSLFPSLLVLEITHVTRDLQNPTCHFNAF